MGKKASVKPNLYKVSEHTWFYRERRGVLVVHESCTVSGVHIQTDQFTIPWRLLKSAIADHEKK